MKSNSLKLSVSVSLLTFLIGSLSFAQAVATDICQGLSNRCQVNKIKYAAPPDVEDQYVLDVNLGPLTEAQFKTLQGEYRAQLFTTFDSQRNYKLSDFFPQFMQKLNGKVLVPHELPADPALVKTLRAQKKNVDKVVYVDGNCHSVTWQWINYLQGKGSQEALLTLGSGENLGLENPIDAHGIQMGDVLVVSGNGGFSQDGNVLHSAVYLGHGLMFEKPNPGEEYAYRISYLADVVGKYRKVDAQAAFNFYRIDKNTRVLPTLVEELSLANASTQAGFSVNLSAIPVAIQQSYILQENWDNRANESVYTLGRILKTSEVSAKNFKSLLPN